MANMISGYPSASPPAASSGTALASTATASSIPASTPSATSRDTISISSFGARMTAAESSSAQRNASLSHKQLATVARKNIETVFYPLTADAKAKAALDVPDPSDPASLKQAQQASAYVNDGAPNPFAGLSRADLSIIANDESGAFAINERRAALMQSHTEEQAWRTRLAAQAVAEYNATGKLTGFFKEALEHFNLLPAMEQALAPANYASDLTAKIKLDFNYLTGIPGQSGDRDKPAAALDRAAIQYPAATVATVLERTSGNDA